MNKHIIPIRRQRSLKFPEPAQYGANAQTTNPDAISILPKESVTRIQFIAGTLLHWTQIIEHDALLAMNEISVVKLK